MAVQQHKRQPSLFQLGEQKRCSKCTEFKPCSEFSRHKTGKHGLLARCRACHAEGMRRRAERDREKNRAYQKALRLRDPEAYRAKQKARRDRDGRLAVRLQQRAWASLNPERKIFTSAKSRAKKKGLEFTITLEDIMPLPQTCPVLGIPLRRGQGTDDPHSYSLDRIDNSRGYVPGNVAIISVRANRLKRDATPEEILALAKWITEITSKKS